MNTNILGFNLNAMTLEDVIESFTRNKLVPRRNLFLKKEGKRICACGIGAVIFDVIKEHFPHIQWKDVRDYIENLELYEQSSFLEGFIAGWDGTEITSSLRNYRKGYKLGQKAWEELTKKK